MLAATAWLLLPVRVLTLAEALHTAEVNQPKLRQAKATTEASQARADEARAPLLPQVTGTASYQRTTANYASRPGALPSQLSTGTSTSIDTFNYFNFGVVLTQLVYDFGQTWGRWRATQATIEAQAAAEKDTWRLVAAQVRTAYFTARAQKALVEVARETLENQQRHLRQVEGFVTVGNRPEIDLYQSRADVANARLQTINAESGYATALAQLQQTIGLDGPVDYDVANEMLPPVTEEDATIDAMLPEALRARPDMISLEKSIRAQELAVRAQKGAYGPSISVSTGVTEAGSQIDDMAWNWNATANLNYPLFQGLLVPAQVREQQANLRSLRAQLDGLKQQVRFDLEQARLGVRGAREALVAANEVLVNARQRLHLAEGRYTAGVGNIIELDDAQLAVTSAAAQRVQAEYSLSTARAALLRALGR